MNPAIFASFLPVLASFSGTDMSPTSLSEGIKLEANRIGIEQRVEINQQQDFTSLMDKQDKQARVVPAVNLQPQQVAQRGTENSRSIAVQPQADRNTISTLAVYGNQDQGKQAPMLAVYPSSERTGRTEYLAISIEWANDTHAFTSERTEQTGRKLA